MKLIDRQLVRELLGPFAFGVAMFSSVLFAGTYLLKLTNWVMNGMPLITAIEVIVLYLPSIIVFTLPMSTLLAVLLALGRLSADSEIVALYSGGVSLYRISIPVICLGVIVSALAIIINEFVAPWANIRTQELQAAAFKQAAVTDRPFTVVDEGTGSVIRVEGGMDPDTNTLRDVWIVRSVNRRPKVIVYARKAEWAGVEDREDRYRWRLYDGYWQLTGDGPTAISTFRASTTREIRIEKTPQQLSLYQKDPDQMSFSEISKMVKYVRAHPDRPMQKIRELEVDRWNKLAVPIASLVFAALAASLGVRSHRSSSSVGLGLSILVILIYYMIWHYTSSLAVQGNLAPVAGAFLADAVGIAAAVVLLVRAAG